MKFTFSLGDWSDSGHGKSDLFTISSDAETINEIREAYFKSCLVFPLDKMFQKYEEDYLSCKNSYLLKNIGLDPYHYFVFKEDKDGDEYAYAIDGTNSLALFIIDLLNLIDSTLNLKLIKNQNLPTLQFYGFDDNGRSLDLPGYGLFTN